MRRPIAALAVALCVAWPAASFADPQGGGPGGAPGPAATHLGLGVAAAPTVDPTNLAMVVLVAVGQVVTWLVMFRSGRQKDVQKAVDGANHDSAQVSAVTDLVKSNERIAAALEGLERWSREHERNDDKFQSRAEEILRAQAATTADMARMLDNVQRQVVNVALGLAPADVTPIPATRHHP